MFWPYQRAALGFGLGCWLEAEWDKAGSALRAGGVLNGAGLGDLVVGASANDEEGPEAGKVYLIFSQL